MRHLFRALGLLAVTCVALIVGLVFATRGTYPVLPLVTADKALPAVTIGGVKLHLHKVDGPPDAPVIIVLHGGPGGDFRSLLSLDALSDTHTVVFYDQRGAGRSERVPQDQLSLDHYIAELDIIAGMVAPDAPVILIGHSWGAMLATAYLGRHPNRVQSAVLIEPGYLDSAGKSAWDTEAKRYMSGVTYWTEAILTGFRAQHADGPDAAVSDDFLIGHMVRVFANHPENPYHCGGGYGAPGWRFGAMASRAWADAPAGDPDRLAAQSRAFPGPVLLLAGACNTWLGPLQHRHRSLFENADLETIPDAGHDVIWDNPDAALAVIRGFLRSTMPKGAPDRQRTHHARGNMTTPI